MRGTPECVLDDRDVDDAAPAGGDHVGQRGLHDVEDAVEIDVDDLLPTLEGQVGERREIA